MVDEIKKHTFKQDAELQIEVVQLSILTTVRKDYLIAPHRTNFYHIFLLENCHATHVVDFEAHKVEPYSLMFINKDRVHQFDPLLDYDGRILIFTDDFFCRTESDATFLRGSILFNDLAAKPTIQLNQADFRRYSEICDHIAEEFSSPTDNAKHTLLRNLLHNFLLLAEREKRKQGYPELKKSADLDYTISFRDLLERNYVQTKGVNDYAQILSISEKRLGQATTKVLGKSPKEIIHDRIVLEAKRLLAHTHLSIKEIGQSLGFDDSAYFVRYFKKNTNATPVEFRESQRSK